MPADKKVAGTVLGHRSPPCSADRLETETRSERRIVHSELDVKSWAASPPACAAVRPTHCPACGAASREPGRALGIVGHGRRPRTIEGPRTPGGDPVLTEVLTRRYECRACSAIIVVVPRGVGRGYRYSLSAIAWALALWGYERAIAASVRRRTSTAKTVGAASATRWGSLMRWTRQALALFGFEPDEAGTLRQRAAAVAAFVAAHAPVAQGPVAPDAFLGAAFCRAG